MSEMQNKLTKLLKEDSALCEKICQQETIEAAYALAESALPGLTVEDLCNWAKAAFSDGQELTDEQLAGAAGGTTYCMKKGNDLIWKPYF